MWDKAEVKISTKQQQIHVHSITYISFFIGPIPFRWCPIPHFSRKPRSQLKMSNPIFIRISRNLFNFSFPSSPTPPTQVVVIREGQMIFWLLPCLISCFTATVFNVQHLKVQADLLKVQEECAFSSAM